MPPTRYGHTQTARRTMPPGSPRRAPIRTRTARSATSTSRDRPVAETRELAFVDAIQEALREEMRRDDSVYLIAEDVTVKQLERARKGLAEEFGEARVLNGPIAETAILAAAFGSAVTGMRPVVEIASI